MTKQLNIFDLKQGEIERDKGRSRAEFPRAEVLQIAKMLAVNIALEHPDKICTIDDVMYSLIEQGYSADQLGPAAGSVFKSKIWEFTGKRINSSRVSSHAREIKVWKLALGLKTQ